MQQIKERGALPMIDSDIRQQSTVVNDRASLPGAGYIAEHKADSLIAKFKEAGGTVREIDGRRVTAIISALVICIIVCLSWAVNHYRDNAITYKAQRDKNARELKLANAAITDMQMRQRDVAALDAKYTKELADAAEMMFGDDVAAGRRRLHIKVARQSVKPLSPPVRIMQPPPDWQTPLNGIISPSERG